MVIEHHSIRKLIKAFLFFLCTSALFSQDNHFSQYLTAPVLFNPALTGSIDGTYRISINYRDQWQHLDNGGFKTTAVSGDMNFASPFKLFQGDLIGLGASFMTDKSGLYGFATNELAGLISYKKLVGKNQYLSLGFKIGIRQSGINYENLKFEDQYAVGQGYDLRTAEVLPENNVYHSEVALGLSYTWRGNKNQGLDIGVSTHHLTSPDYSFFNLSLPANVILVKQPLYGLKTIHANASFPLAEQIALLPRVWLLSQGPHFQANLGSMVRFPLDQDGLKLLHLGGHIRMVNNDNQFNLESMIPQLGLEMGNFKLGFSYDANARKLASNYFNQSIFELSLQIIGSHDNGSNYFCPTF